LNTELFRAPEILFKPQLQGLDIPGLHYLIYDSIISCPLDVRKDILSSIALGGGTSYITGLKPRLTEELSDLDSLLFDKKCKVQVTSNTEEPSVWIGACVFSSLSTFNSTVISKEQYDELESKMIDKQFSSCRETVDGGQSTQTAKHKDTGMKYNMIYRQAGDKTSNDIKLAK